MVKRQSKVPKKKAIRIVFCVCECCLYKIKTSKTKHAECRLIHGARAMTSYSVNRQWFFLFLSNEFAIFTCYFYTIYPNCIYKLLFVYALISENVFSSSFCCCFVLGRCCCCCLHVFSSFQFQIFFVYLLYIFIFLFFCFSYLFIPTPVFRVLILHFGEEWK